MYLTATLSRGLTLSVSVIAHTLSPLQYTCCFVLFKEIFELVSAENNETQNPSLVKDDSPRRKTQCLMFLTISWGESTSKVLKFKYEVLKYCF